MRTNVILVLLLLMIVLPALSRVVTLEGLVKPDLIVVKGNKLYVLEKTSIYIYSVKDFQLIKKFGREGEGPREFMARPYGPPMSMSFVDRQLVVNSNNKLSYFDVDGIFLNERKAFANLVLFQVRDNFVAIGPSVDAEKRFRISYRLYSNDLKELKNLFHTNISVNPQDFIIMPISAIGHNPCYKGNIFIAASNTDFVIDVFNHTGKKIRRISRNFVKEKIPQKFKDETHYWFKNESMYKQFYDGIKGFIKFKDHFPAIRDVHLADETIYVVTHKRKKNLWECVLLDMIGREKKRVFIPLSRYVPFTYYPLLYSVENRVLYSLIEDEDEEVWKLHIVNLF
ncbi:MAG: hypothetical protein KAS65_03660 [Candidatus Aminicenantes bacterium]|nr:hypothetical protein [Candidatus Aminicenantes bacterium]